MSIKTGYYVECIYDLYRGKDNKEEKLEMATEEAPFQFILGKGFAMPAFEKHLEGLNEGDTFDFNLDPKDAFGEVREDLILKLEKSVFTNHEGEFDAEHVVEGNMLPMQTNDGQVVHGQVTEVGDSHVEMDFNHPYAGLDLHFVGKITVAREATAEDEATLHARLHGHNCGGGCGDCHSDDSCDSSSNEGCSCGCGCGCH